MNYFYSLYHGEDAPANPWNADSLEWATDSPPPNYGFADLPVVRSRHPLWDQATIHPKDDDRVARLMDALSHYPTEWRAALTTTAIDARPQEIFRVSGPSIWPFVTAVGLIIVFGSEIFSLRTAAAIGLVIMVGGLAGWHWPDKLQSTEEELAFEREHGIPVRINGSRIVSQWAMNLLILIVAIAFTCLLFSYFYIRVESPTWPTDGIANPGLLWPAVSSLLLLLSGGAMRWALCGIEGARQGQLRLGLAAVFGLGVVALGLLINDFRQVPFTIGTNAYGSLYYTINGFVFALVIAGLLQNIYTQVWAWQGHYSAEEHVAINVTGTWWWVTIVFWLIAMGVVYVGPYVI